MKALVHRPALARRALPPRAQSHQPTHSGTCNIRSCTDTSSHTRTDSHRPGSHSACDIPDLHARHSHRARQSRNHGRPRHGSPLRHGATAAGPHELHSRGLIRCPGGHRRGADRHRGHHRRCCGENANKMHDTLLSRINLGRRPVSASERPAHGEMTRRNGKVLDRNSRRSASSAAIPAPLPLACVQFIAARPDSTAVPHGDRTCRSHARCGPAAGAAHRPARGVQSPAALASRHEPSSSSLPGL